MFPRLTSPAESSRASAIVAVPHDAHETPVIAWAHGTTGYATGCAPSLLEEPLVAGGMPIRAYEEALDAGWAFISTDYIGLGTAGDHPYLIGQGEGRSVLDAIRAASDLPEFLSAVSQSLVGGVFGSFVLAAYEAEYPDVHARDYVRPGARIALEEMSRRCLTDPVTLVSVATTLAGYHPVWIGDPAHGPFLERARENVPVLPVASPVFIAQGETDDLVLPDLQRAYVEARCADGWALDYRTYADRDHMGVVADDSPLVDDLVGWTAARFAGEAVPAGCALD